MAQQAGHEPEVCIVRAAAVKDQAWWPQLHSTIITAFLHKPENITVFPPDWERLPDDPITAAGSLASELGDHGHLIALLSNGQTIACTGVLPYRGDGWISDASSGKDNADIANASTLDCSDAKEGIQDWEVCCFCVSPSDRGQGVSYRLLSVLESFVKQRGAERLYTNYAEIETGDFWPRLGFEVIPGAGGTLKKGFKVHPDKEGLRDDIVFKMAVKRLNS